MQCSVSPLRLRLRNLLDSKREVEVVRMLEVTPRQTRPWKTPDSITEGQLWLVPDPGTG